MPLPGDEQLLALAHDVLAQFDTIFGLHPGFRPAHAKGTMLRGMFTPSAGAAGLTRAVHLSRPQTPVLVRFSNSTGLPLLPDNDPQAEPRGMAIRFVLGEHTHTDIIAHSTDGFPARTGADFLEFLRAVASSDPAHPAGSPLEAYLGSHPAAVAFLQAPKPAPTSFARETYFGVTALEFINAAGEGRFGRYRMVPVEGNEFVDADALKSRGPDYLMREIQERVTAAAVTFKVLAQLADPGDVVDDATVHWGDDRELFELGTLELTGVVENDSAEQKTIIFDPIPRIDGIEPSGDPLLELRAAIYLLSGRRRRAA